MNFSSLNQKLKYDTAYADYNLPTFEKIQEFESNNSNNMEMALKGDIFKVCDRAEGIDEVGNIFFSGENVSRIQKMIKRDIYNKTKGVFRLDTNQDESDLLVAMRALYYDHGKFLPFNIIRQVKELNRKLLEYIMPDIITQVKQSYSYIQEINQPIKPLTRPINVNNAGRRALPGLSTVWGI